MRGPVCVFYVGDYKQLCLFVCLFVCLLACLLACLFVCGGGQEGNRAQKGKADSTLSTSQPVP